MILQGTTPPATIELIKDIIKDKVVCDVGCSTGEFMELMAKYAKEVIGIEEDKEIAEIASKKGFTIYNKNTFFEPLPKADVYYLWTKDCVGLYLKAKWEGTKGTFIFGESYRPSTVKFLKEIKPEVRGKEFKVYITTL